MSILLKGIEMPQENELIIINSNGDIEKVKCDGTTWLCDSKAIELPPHGRLIDADALRLLYDFSGYKPTGDMTEEEFDRLMYRLPVIRAIIDEAPTIIEAEEGK